MGLPVKGKAFLITGGAGFLGSWLTERIASEGGRVICIDNLSSGSRSNIKHPGIRFREADVCDSSMRIPGKIDYIVHAASIASPDYYQKRPLETIGANTTGLLNMLALAREKKVKGFLFTSTSEVYGNPPDAFVPTPEEYYGNVNSFGPRSCYDESKRCGEAICYTFFTKYNMPIRIARIFNTYGPRLRSKEGSSYGRVIPRFIEQSLAGTPMTVFGDGTQTRSFCYVNDQIDGLLRLLLTDGIDGEVVNLGAQEEMTVLRLAKDVRKLTSSDSAIEFFGLPRDDPRRRCPDIRKARKLLGFRPKTKIKEGLIRTIGWLRGDSE